MRVRILKPLVGVVDRISLSRMIPGAVYDLPAITANFLISQRSAETVRATKAARAPDDFSQFLGGVRVTMPRAEADDTPRPKPKKRR